jgi:hypothetical protein
MSAGRIRASRRVPPGRKLAAMAEKVPLKAMNTTAARRSDPLLGMRVAYSTTRRVK